MAACPICSSEHQNYPVVDTCTGWRFCGDCWHELMQHLRELQHTRTIDARPTFPQWLRAIATVHERHGAALAHTVCP